VRSKTDLGKGSALVLTKKKKDVESYFFKCQTPKVGNGGRVRDKSQGKSKNQAAGADLGTRGKKKGESFDNALTRLVTVQEKDRGKAQKKIAKVKKQDWLGENTTKHKQTTEGAHPAAERKRILTRTKGVMGFESVEERRGGRGRGTQSQNTVEQKNN